ncbi:MAG: hypothetical protein HC911_10285 [Chloroflexaceae bacterium]|nr:hypothetical protein [Chloroflexaceae bacterium]
MEYRVLIVGDDAATRNRYAKTLIDAPLPDGNTYKVMTVSSAAAAQLQVTRQQFHAVLIVLALYNEVLLDLARRLKELYPEMQILILHEAQTTLPMLETVRRMGVHNVKVPIEDVHLQACLARILNVVAATDAANSVLPAFAKADLELVDVYNMLDDLRRQARAQLVLFSDNIGNLIAKRGDETNIDVTVLASLIAGGFVNSVEMGCTLNDPETVHLSFHEGRYFDVYSVNVGTDRLLVLFFDKQFAEPKLGFVWLMMKRVAGELRRMHKQERRQPDVITDQFQACLSSEIDRLFGAEQFAGNRSKRNLGSA